MVKGDGIEAALTAMLLTAPMRVDGSRAGSSTRFDFYRSTDRFIRSFINARHAYNSQP